MTDEHEQRKKILEDIVKDFSQSVIMEGKHKASETDPDVRKYITNTTFHPEEFEYPGEAEEHYKKTYDLNMAAPATDVTKKIRETRGEKQVNVINYAAQNINDIVSYLKPEQVLNYAINGISPQKIGNEEHDAVAKIHEERNEMISNIAGGNVKKMMDYCTKGYKSKDLEYYSKLILASDDAQHSKLSSWYQIGIRARENAMYAKLSKQEGDSLVPDKEKATSYLMKNVEKADEHEKNGFYFNAALDGSGLKGIDQIKELLRNLEKGYAV